MKCGAVALGLFGVFAGCGSSPPRRAGNQASRLRADERSYLSSRREERSCSSLKTGAEVDFVQGNHARALESAELLIAYCPREKLHAVEKTLLVLARPEANAERGAGAVRLRFHAARGAPYRIFSLGAYADGKLGLNNLSPGPHKITVQVDLWAADRGGGPHMVRLEQSLTVAVDSQHPVVLNAAVELQSSSLTPLGLRLDQAPVREEPPPAPGLVQAGMLRLENATRAETPYPPSPEPLAKAGFSATVDLEICVDEHGIVSRVTPLSWPHPRYLGTYIDGLRAWRLRPLSATGEATGPFCTGWRQTLEATLSGN